MTEYFMIVTEEGKYSFVYKVILENTQKKTSQTAKNKLFANIFPCMLQNI